MNKEEWKEVSTISRLNHNSEAVYKKIMTVMDYVACLADYKGEWRDDCIEDYSLSQIHLRKDEIGESFSSEILTKLSKSFVDGYFIVPKVLVKGES